MPVPRLISLKAPFASKVQDRHAPHRERSTCPPHQLLPESPRTWRTLLINTPLGWVCSLALATLGIYLLANHGVHIVTALPYLLLLACPLMHLFMHGGHGHHDKRG